jgi:hypothetical protein
LIHGGLGDRKPVKLIDIGDVVLGVVALRLLELDDAAAPGRIAPFSEIQLAAQRQLGCARLAR